MGEPPLDESIVLQLDESPPDHPFAAVQLYHADIALLNYLLQDLRALVRRAAAGEIQLVAHETIEWQVHGLRRRTIVCDPQRLLQRHDVEMVGFFGDRRAESDGSAVDEVEVKLHLEFRNYPGILSYSSIELVDNQWADLVVHSEPEDRQAWRSSRVHVYAAEELAPRVYHNVRIHNGCIPDGAIGSETVVIETTKYWDYDVFPTWRASRELPGGATGTVGSPWTDLAAGPP